MERQQIFWYLTRSSALVCWCLAMLSVLTGLLLSSRLLGRRPTVPWLTDIHRGLSWLALVFLAGHMASLLADPFVGFGIADVVIPGVAIVPGVTRLSLALGVLAAWLMAIVQLSSMIKERIAQRTWHTIHLLSFGVVILGTVHAILLGSEIDNPIVLSLGTFTLAVLLLAMLGRYVRLRQHTAAAQREALSRVGYKQRSAAMSERNPDTKSSSKPAQSLD